VSLKYGLVGLDYADIADLNMGNTVYKHRWYSSEKRLVQDASLKSNGMRVI